MNNNILVVPYYNSPTKNIMIIYNVFALTVNIKTAELLGA